MNFVDTNYFLRFLLKDNVQHKIAKSLFMQAARGKVTLSTSLIVMFEIYWVLFSYYEKQKQEIVNIFLKILLLNFSFPERKVFTEALEYFKDSNLSLEDCYNLSYAKEHNVSDFKTFDKKLKKHFNPF